MKPEITTKHFTSGHKQYWLETARDPRTGEQIKLSAVVAPAFLRNGRLDNCVICQQEKDSCVNGVCLECGRRDRKYIPRKRG